MEQNRRRASNHNLWLVFKIYIYTITAYTQFTFFYSYLWTI